MSDDYSNQIEQIRKATSPEKIHGIPRRYPANASCGGGVLYGGDVDEVRSEAVASNKEKHLGLI